MDYDDRPRKKKGKRKRRMISNIIGTCYKLCVIVIVVYACAYFVSAGGISKATGAVIPVITDVKTGINNIKGAGEQLKDAGEQIADAVTAESDISVEPVALIQEPMDENEIDDGPIYDDVTIPYIRPWKDLKTVQKETRRVSASEAKAGDLCYLDGTAYYIVNDGMCKVFGTGDVIPVPDITNAKPILRIKRDDNADAGNIYQFNGQEYLIIDGGWSIPFWDASAKQVTETPELELEYINELIIIKNQNQINPTIIDNTSIAPVREVTSAIGADISWDTETETATLSKNETTIVIQPDNSVIYVNGEPKKINTIKPYEINGTLYVPVREIAEAFGAEVVWDDNTQAATVVTAQPDDLLTWDEPEPTPTNTPTPELTAAPIPVTTVTPMTIPTPQPERILRPESQKSGPIAVGPGSVKQEPTPLLEPTTSPIPTATAQPQRVLRPESEKTVSIAVGPTAQTQDDILEPTATPMPTSTPVPTATPQPERVLRPESQKSGPVACGPGSRK